MSYLLNGITRCLDGISLCADMMTSSNGNIFHVTGHLCGEFTGPGEFPAQSPVARSFNVFFDLRLNKRLSKQSWGWWFETLLCPLWRHCNGNSPLAMHISISKLPLFQPKMILFLDAAYMHPHAKKSQCAIKLQYWSFCTLLPEIFVGIKLTIVQWSFQKTCLYVVCWWLRSVRCLDICIHTDG